MTLYEVEPASKGRWPWSRKPFIVVTAPIWIPAVDVFKTKIDAANEMKKRDEMNK